jgi:polar amino acid transport system permease protein
MSAFDVLANYWPMLLHGLGLTLLLTGMSAVLAGAISLPLAIVRVGAGSAAQVPLRLYISFMRGTPLLGQLFLVYYGSGQFREELQSLGLWTFFRNPFNCAILTFTLNSVAYQIEILRGGLMGVPVGQVEAAKAVGMTRLQSYLRVILPHAYRIAQPALGNEIILLMKGSAVASVITIFDLMGETKTIFAKTFDFSIYLWAAVIYLAVTALFVQGWRYLEAFLNPHLAGHAPAEAPHPVMGMR